MNRIIVHSCETMPEIAENSVELMDDGELDLSGQVALVTGGSLGRAFALASYRRVCS